MPFRFTARTAAAASIRSKDTFEMRRSWKLLKAALSSWKYPSRSMSARTWPWHKPPLISHTGNSVIQLGAPSEAAEPARRSNIKCVVWDLDNTVWNGILLEDENVE